MVLLAWGSTLLASHNLAGQLFARRVRSTDPTANSNLYELVLNTYTDPAPMGVDRCTATIEVWSVDGNGQFSFVAFVGPIPRENGPLTSCFTDNGNQNIPNGVKVRGTIKKNVYRTQYLLPGPGRYVFRYYDVARWGNVKNMDNSGGTAFFVETMVLNSPITPNTSPQLLNDPLDEACTRRLWTHNPGAYDADGDSLAYSLINCQQYDPAGGLPRPVSVQNYQYPGAFGGQFTIDPVTGLVSWNTPSEIGVYNISILVQEYRRGVLIGYVIRDMAIFVEPCNNEPPQIRALSDTCLAPGENLTFEIEARDPDGRMEGLPPTLVPWTRDSVYLYLNNANSGNNGPFQLTNSPATITPAEANFPLRYPEPTGLFDTDPRDPPNAPYITNPLTQIPPDPVFSWTPLCEHIRTQHYQVDFYAHDNFGNDPTLAANHIVTIRVKPPVPTGLVVTSGSRSMILNWDPSTCTNATGYRIYRSLDSNTSFTDTVCCDNAISGYQMVGQTTGWNSTSFVDDNEGEGLPFSSRYCYRITAMFGTLESCPSNIDCETIRRDVPVMLIDSVLTTNSTTGQIKVAWQRPNMALINTTFFPPPYTWTLQRAVGHGGTTFVNVQTGMVFADTSYIDNNLNTDASPYTYRVIMFDVTGREVEKADPAGSIYLSTSGQQNAIRLVWEEQVPWSNYTYEVWRRDPGQPTFNRIAIVTASGSSIGNSLTQHTYLDSPLPLDPNPAANNTFCYYILGKGSYFVPGLKDSLFNASQVSCDEPIDREAPCLPPQSSITLQGNCQTFSVNMEWEQPDFACASDLAYFRIYYAPKPDQPYSLLYQSPDATTQQYTATDPLQQGLGGCYVLTTVDLRGNESPYSQPLCYENCPAISFPNVFTPNGDGVNDLFIPIEYRNVLRLNVKIFNRWGMLMNESTDPANLWDGKMPNGEDALPGHYFWVGEIVLNDFEETKLVRSGGLSLLR